MAKFAFLFLSHFFFRGPASDNNTGGGKLLYGPDSCKLAGETGHSIEYVMSGQFFLKKYKILRSPLFSTAGPTGERHRFFQCWTLRFGFAFIMIMSSPMNEFSKHINSVKKAIELFELLPDCERCVCAALACLTLRVVRSQLGAFALDSAQHRGGLRRADC